MIILKYNILSFVTNLQSSIVIILLTIIYNYRLTLIGRYHNI